MESLNKFLILLLLIIFNKSYCEDCFVAIIGTGRCGTKYISNALCSLGLDIPHEKLGNNGIVSAYLLGNKNLYSNNGYRTGYGLTFTHVLHQVRHPLKVISSFLINIAEQDTFWDFVNDEIDEFHPTDPFIVKVAKYWYYWNLKAEDIAEWTYRIEDVKVEFAELCTRLGLPVNNEILNDLPDDTNHWREVFELTWNQLGQMLTSEGESDLFENIQVLALKYGYSITDENSTHIKLENQISN